MPRVILNEAEMALLSSVPLNSIGYRPFQLDLYHLQLLVDTQTGELELPGELWENVRVYAFDMNRNDWRALLVGIFGRTLGPNLDLGFFDET